MMRALKCEWCASLGNMYYPWTKKKMKGITGLFYTYYEAKVGKVTYFKRVNKLDRLFDWICFYV